MTKDIKELLDEMNRQGRRLQEVEAQRERDNIYFTVQLEQLKARVLKLETLLPKAKGTK